MKAIRIKTELILIKFTESASKFMYQLEIILKSYIFTKYTWILINNIIYGRKMLCQEWLTFFSRKVNRKSASCKTGPRRLLYIHTDRSRGIPLIPSLPPGAHVSHTYYGPNTNSTWKRELLEGAQTWKRGMRGETLESIDREANNQP